MPTVTQGVDAWELRRRFQECGIEEKVAQGAITVKVVKNGHPSPAPANQPYCTRSQLLEYRDRQGGLIALAHQYLRPDGNIGASGRPDPKKLRDGDTLYVYIPDLDRPRR